MYRYDLDEYICQNTKDGIKTCDVQNRTTLETKDVFSNRMNRNKLIVCSKCIECIKSIERIYRISNVHRILNVYWLYIVYQKYVSYIEWCRMIRYNISNIFRLYIVYRMYIVYISMCVAVTFSLGSLYYYVCSREFSWGSLHNCTWSREVLMCFVRFSI